MGHRYQLTARIESGEISELYRGTQDGAREVTLKLFSPKASDPAYGKAVIDAAKKIGALQHPAILYYEEVGLVRDRLCCARAGIDGFHLGTALSRLATKEVVLPPAVALQVMIEALTAIGAAHQAGLAHGAITPANILLARDGRVFVTDFMALWAMERSPAMKVLASRGRQAYRAPEVAKGHEPDAGADVYSAGAVLYELLTLREVASMRGGGVSTRRDVLTPPSRLDRRVNARLDPLVLKALEALKSRRYKSCTEMAESLRSFQGATGAAAGRDEVARFVRELFPNEMGIASGETPWADAFTLEAIDLNRTIPGLRIDARDREPYSQPAPLESAPLESTRMGEATDMVSAMPEPAASPEASTAWDVSSEEGNRGPAPEATALDLDPVGLGARGAALASPEKPSFESWEAPPGELDPAVARKLNPEPEGPRARRPVEPARAARPIPATVPSESLHDFGPPTPAESPPAAPASVTPLELPPPPRLKAAASKHVGPPSSRPPQPGKAREDKPDWHVVIPPPPPPPKPHTPLKWWVAAVLMASAAAGLAYLGLQRRIGHTGKRAEKTSMGSRS